VKVEWKVIIDQRFGRGKEAPKEAFIVAMLIILMAGVKVLIVGQNK
jgi:hypothetical protein